MQRLALPSSRPRCHRPEVPVDQVRVGALIRLLLGVRAVARRTDSLLGRVAATRDCSAADCLLLWELAGLAGQVGHRRPSDLATASGLASSTVATRLAGLEAAGLVVRERESGHRRAVAVRPTPAGARFARETFDEFALGAADLLRDPVLARFVDVSGSGRSQGSERGTLDPTATPTEEER
jgi:DNA-binding MarR family transcriptional regulator